MNSDPNTRLLRLRMIEAFEAVVRLGSRSKAAAELNVTPGAISKQLRQLEEWGGHRLFEKGRPGDLTADGRAFAQAVMAGVAQIREGLDGLNPNGRSPVHLKISAPATFAMKWLVRRLPALEQGSLPIKVTVHPTNTNEDWAGLPHDAAIRREDFTPPGYEARILVREELTAFVRPNTAAQVPSPERVVHCESITRPGDLDRWLAAAGVTQAGHPRRQYAHFYIAYEAALAGEGLVVAPTFIAAADVQAGRLVAPWPSVHVPGAQCFLVYPKANRNLIAPFADWIREEIGSKAHSRFEGA